MKEASAALLEAVDQEILSSTDEMDNQELMLRYKETGDENLKWELVLRFQEQIRRIAIRTCGLYSSFHQLDDVIHEGILTLLGAIDRFDPQKGVKLETFVAKRLRGMVIDLGRKQDWMPRQLRQKSNRLNRAMEELSVELGRMPTGQEVADYMGMTREEYEKTLSDTAGANLISFEMLLDTYGGMAGRMVSQSHQVVSPEDYYEEQELRQALEAAIASLRDNEKLVLSLYYERELTMKEISEVLGVSTPRVSQIHSHAIAQLRTYLQQELQQ